MNTIKKIAAHAFVFSLLFLVSFPALMHAQRLSGNGTSQDIKIDNPLKSGNNLYDLINTVFNNIIMPIAGVLCVMYIIYAGFLYVQAQGNPKKIQEANQNLLYALIGTGILLGAAGISAAVKGTIEGLTNH